MPLEDTSQLLARAARILASATLDFDRTLASISGLLIPAAADWFAVDLINSAGGLDRAHVSHSDPGKVALAHMLYAQHPPLRDAKRGQWSVIDSCTPEWVPAIDDDWIDAMARDAQHRSRIAGLSLRSYIRVPLSLDRRPLGVLTVVFAESGRAYDESDIAVIEELGAMVASAVYNAQSHARLQELMRRNDEFLATLAHELRNPLAPILTSAQLLDRTAGNPELVRQASGVIERHVRHMITLVDDLVDVARVNRGDFAIASERVDLSSVVSEAVEQARPRIEERGHKLEVEFPERTPWVTGDATRLVQIVANVIGNAAKYTPNGGHVRLAVSSTGRHVSIEVADDGIGIAPDFLPKVFDMFSQQSQSFARHHAGLGIGLALVKRLVELHGGSIHAESEGVGKGARFTIRLPEAQPRADAPQVERSGARTPTSEPESEGRLAVQ